MLYVFRMKAVLVLALALAGGCGNDTRLEDTSPDGSQPDDVDAAVLDGATAYAMNCARCHGVAGEGTATKGPQIGNPVRGFAKYTVRNGRTMQLGFETGMDAYPEEFLSEATLDAIMDFLAATPKPTTGPELFRRFCGNCHGATARGGRTGQDITEELDKVSEQVREGNGGTNYGSRTKYMPRWSTAELTDAEVGLIRAAIPTL
jgi:mono/diheme cytochrome c family protein